MADFQKEFLFDKNTQGTKYYDWIVPAGVYMLPKIECWSAGGFSGTDRYNSWLTKGKGGTYSAIYNVAVNPGDTIGMYFGSSIYDANRIYVYEMYVGSLQYRSDTTAVKVGGVYKVAAAAEIDVNKQYTFGDTFFYGGDLGGSAGPGGPGSSNTTAAGNDSTWPAPLGEGGVRGAPLAPNWGGGAGNPGTASTRIPGGQGGVRITAQMFNTQHMMLAL